jgi:HD superfamily phosphohydrolase YqeK
MLARKLSLDVDINKLRYAALAHDILKEKSFNISVREINIGGINIPQDLNWYVRKNLDILELYGLDDYFNSDAQLHALSAGIFLHKELNITDPDIIYPVFFHSCPIISIYETLDPHTQALVDIIMLSDKLSSNKLKRELKKISYNLEVAVFGESNTELNYSLGLLLARLIAQGNSPGKHAIIATDFYHRRLMKTQPFMTEKSLEVIKLWLKKQ